MSTYFKLNRSTCKVNCNSSSSNPLLSGFAVLPIATCPSVSRSYFSTNLRQYHEQQLHSLLLPTIPSCCLHCRVLRTHGFCRRWSGADRGAITLLVDTGRMETLKKRTLLRPKAEQVPAAEGSTHAHTHSTADPQQTSVTPKKQCSVLANCPSQSQLWQNFIPWHEVTTPQLLDIAPMTWKIIIYFCSALSVSAITHSHFIHLHKL